MTFAKMNYSDDKVERIYTILFLLWAHKHFLQFVTLIFTRATLQSLCTHNRQILWNVARKWNISIKWNNWTFSSAFLHVVNNQLPDNKCPEIGAHFEPKRLFTKNTKNTKTTEFLHCTRTEQEFRTWGGDYFCPRLARWVWWTWCALYYDDDALYGVERISEIGGDYCWPLYGI